MVGLSERAVVYKAKESDLLSRREFYHKGRIQYLPTGYVAAIVCEFESRKATKKCVEQGRERVLVLYSKATIWKFGEAIYVRLEPRVETSLRSELY